MPLTGICAEVGTALNILSSLSSARDFSNWRRALDEGTRMRRKCVSLSMCGDRSTLDIFSRENNDIA